MVEYHDKFDGLMERHRGALLMERRLRIVEEECRGLFNDPLGLSPHAAIAFFESYHDSEGTDEEWETYDSESGETDEEFDEPDIQVLAVLQEKAVRTSAAGAKANRKLAHCGSLLNNVLRMIAPVVNALSG